MSDLLLFNKPFNVLCQFTDESEQAQDRETLANYIDQKGFYAAGRLDRDSEGLLLLTDNGKLQHQITDPQYKLPKTYWVQLEGDVTKEAINQLKKGVELKDGVTRPADCKKMDEPKWLWERNPPIRQRQNIPTSWIALTITEGKNRQVRRMTAAVGFPTLRLIRAKIGDWSLKGIEQPGKTLLLENQKLKTVAVKPQAKTEKPTLDKAANKQSQQRQPEQRKSSRNSSDNRSRNQKASKVRPTSSRKSGGQTKKR